MQPLCARLRALGVALWLAACASGGAPPATEDLERAAFDAARQTAARDPAQAIPALRAFLTERPQSFLADDAAVELAKLLRASGDDAGAMQELLWVERRHPGGDRADVARLLLADIQQRRGHSEAAWRTASRVRFRQLSPQDRAQGARLMARIADGRGDPVEALRWLSTARADVPREQLAELEAEIAERIVGMGSEDVARAAEQLGRAYPAARLRMRQVELALAEGDTEAAEKALARASALPLTPQEAEALARLETRVRARHGSEEAPVELPSPGAQPLTSFPDPAGLAGTLGIVLPLSGPFGQLGEDSLQGILLATGMFDAERGVQRSELRLLVRDSQGSAGGAAAAVRELAQEPALLAILGPLGNEETEAAAGAAEAAQVPLVALGRREEVTAQRTQVFRLGLTPRLEAELLAEYAVNALGAQRFAILHPGDAYGQRLRALFWDAVERRGGEVVNAVSYDAEATDFADPIRSLVGYDFLTPGQRAALSEREALLDKAKRANPQSARALREKAESITGPEGEPLPPYVDFDALFIPDAHRNVALITPQLAFHGVRGVRLLGSSGWNDPELLTIARNHVEGAIFPAAVHPTSRRPELAEFARRFETTFGHPVDSFAAESFDAAGILLRQLARNPADRDALRRGLLEAGVSTGVSGVTEVGPDGNAYKRPHLLGVEHGEIISVDEEGHPPAM